MEGKVFDRDGVLRRWWDYDTRTYHEYDEEGTETLSRPFDADEAANADALAAQQAADDKRAALRQQLASGVTAILAARDAASADVAQADNLQAQANTLSQQTQARITAVSAFVPGTTYRQADILAIRDELVSILNRQKTITDAMAGMYAYRKNVDQNAMTTDNALLWLARLASGVLG
jgi:hypothetical protein